MTEWVRGFVTPDVADVHLRFRLVIAEFERIVAISREAGVEVGVAELAKLRRAYVQFQVGLREAAAKAAQLATAGIIDKLNSTAVRPDTGTVPHLRDLIRSAPITYDGLPTGAVGVADVQLLDRAKNPYSPGYGPFWRAQEYGTGSNEVPSQVGRVLHGLFAGAGGNGGEAPKAQYAGGGGPNPVFVPSSGGKGVHAGAGGGGGFGTISVEDRPKHFIRDGADEAAIAWRADMARVQQIALEELAGILP